MLILVRRQNESVDIIDSRTNEIICTVFMLGSIAAGGARLGFEAPKHINIIRDDARARSAQS